MKKISFTILFLMFSLILNGCNKMGISDQNFAKPKNEKLELATFAGGCFWCMEPAYQEQVNLEAVVGFSGGSEKEAKYSIISNGKTKHREVVQVKYDPQKISYEKLLDIFWRQIDPTDEGGQFADRGFQYTTAILYHTEEQKQLAEKSKNDLGKSEKFSKPIATKIEPFKNFFLADEYHQDFYKKSSEHYERYKKGSGRTDFIEENWAKTEAIKQEKENEEKSRKDDYNYTDAEIVEMLENLDPLAYHVVAENGTESPFNNKYWDNKAEGIYVDIVTKKPLFSSTHKYDSGTGWPSFWRTIDDDSVTLHEDNSLSTTRTELRSEGGHIGHVFEDGPEEKGGRRFCTNSASLLFISKEDLEKEGYEKYLELFS